MAYARRGSTKTKTVRLLVNRVFRGSTKTRRSNPDAKRALQALTRINKIRRLVPLAQPDSTKRRAGRHLAIPAQLGVLVLRSERLLPTVHHVLRVVTRTNRAKPLAQDVRKGGIILPQGPRRAPPAQAVPLGSLVTISRWQCLAPRIWWCRTHSVPPSVVRMAIYIAIMMMTGMDTQRVVICILLLYLTSTTTITQGPHPRVA